MKFWFDKILVHRWLPEGQSGDWSIRRTVIEGSRFEWLRMGGDPYGDLLAPEIYTGLFRKLADGSEQRVMFDEPREIKEALRFYEQAHGKVLLTGLGLGMIAAWVASKPEVTQVDVVENSADVIALVAPYLPSEKIRVIHADAFNYRPTEQYDCAWHDCFYTKPNRVTQLKKRFPVPNTDVWQPGVLTQPIPRRSFIGGLVTIALMFAALRIKGAPLPAITGPIQQVTNGVSSGASHPVTITTPGVGNSLIATIGLITGASGMSGGGVTWLQGITALGATGTGNEIWYGHNSSGSGTTVTVTIGGRSGGAAAINITEWSGLNNAAPDVTNQAVAVADTSPTAGSVATTNANSLVISSGAWTANDYSSGPTNSFTRGTAIGATTVFAETAYQVESATGSYSTGWTLSAGVNWASTIAAFGAPAAGPTNAQRSAGFFMNPSN